MYLSQRQFTNHTTANHLDDGVWIGLPEMMTENDVNGAYALSSGPIPINIQNAKQNTVIMNSLNTPAHGVIKRVPLILDTYLVIRTNFTLNTGDLSSVICSLKPNDQSKPWDIPWTGVPIVDKFVCQSGKKFYTLATNLLLRCDKVRPADFYFEWQLEFNTPFSSVWNFVMEYTLDLLTAPYMNMNIVPSLTYTDRDMEHKLQNLQIESDDTDEQHESDYNLPQTLYPPLPSAPMAEAVIPQKPKTKRGILTRLFKRKIYKP
ncbi:hypothetical protein 2 [Hubei permutotetra-like virus 2]|uniref:hypothetical protein 2 n=1 Tax=Hubei permutotetra-like virus 2 TaxID=1923076 RepID=UPI00090CC9B7|nr:hypothetical protein 2 [Hubei permutotetra-like virus 2]APG76935.1 hypothetical protein 2 [Hubei permutotetra-like virus 2]